MSVFLTDYLLEHLTLEEIETIFAHELGHIKHRHLLKQARQPAVFLQALRKLIQLNDGPEDLDTFNEMLSTHPNFTVRAEAIERL